MRSVPAHALRWALGLIRRVGGRDGISTLQETEGSLNIVGWAIAALIACLAIMALTDGMIVATILLLAAALLVAPHPFLRSKLAAAGLHGRRRGVALAVLVLGALAAIGYVQTERHPATTRPTPESSPTPRPTSSSTTSPTSIADTSGQKCLSSWDGTHRGVVTALKDGLREPSSFEHVETRITRADRKGNHKLFMRYRARNGFGGMNIGMVVATIRDSDCAATAIVNTDQ